MTPITLLIIVLILSSVFYFVGRKRAFTVAGGKGARGLHSLPTYYGALTALWCAIPALLVFCLWQMFETAIVTNLVIGDLPDQIRMLPPERLGLVINDIRNLVSGNIVSGEIDPVMQMAADRYRNVQAISMAALTVIALALAVLVALFVRQKSIPACAPETMWKRLSRSS